jgi:very-short-patch-repair endonuclease
MTKEITHMLAEAGGAVTTHELHNAGLTRQGIAFAVRSRQLVRARQGWYVAPGVHPHLLQAVRVGGRLSCRSALKLQGVWVVEDARIHITVDGNSCQLRSPGNAHRRLGVEDASVIHWRDSTEKSRLIVDPVSALEDLCACADPAQVTASADSLLHLDARHFMAIGSLADRMPFAFREALLVADGVCESGIETLFWLPLRHLSPRRQVHIAGIGDVDFLFGERLVVEVDGEQFHTDPLSFENDRRRDALLSALGFRVLRFSYRQVMERWPEVEAAVYAAIARGDRF